LIPKKHNGLINNGYNAHLTINLPNSYYQPLLEQGIQTSPQYVEKVCSLVKERAFYSRFMVTQLLIFYKAPETYDEKVIQKTVGIHHTCNFTRICEILKLKTPLVQHFRRNNKTIHRQQTIEYGTNI
jgi:hypothetical protein